MHLSFQQLIALIAERGYRLHTEDRRQRPQKLQSSELLSHDSCLSISFICITSLICYPPRHISTADFPLSHEAEARLSPQALHKVDIL